MTLPSIQVDLLPNPAFARHAPYGAARAAILSHAGLLAAQAEIASWPGYAPTPMHALNGLTKQLQLARLDYKDEGGRFGLGSFKALGGAYAVARLLCQLLGQQLGRVLRPDDLQMPALRQLCAGITVTSATDGNHGRSVAWGAQLFGCQCVIYIHATVSVGRRDAIAAYGAEVVRTPGNYDAAVRQADADAKTYGRYLISDTSYDGYMDIPRDVMQGYQLMVHEAVAQLPQLPTHIFIQGGVGAVAAAVAAYFWERLGAPRPCLVVVEPKQADCLLQSARQGQRVAVQGELNTVMAGLACGEVSALAWEILASGADAFAALEDQAAIDSMRLLAFPSAGDPPIVAGESAVAGLAALIGVAQCPAQRQVLALDASSRVLIFGTERDTDPQLYRQLVGCSSAEVLALKR